MHLASKLLWTTTQHSRTIFGLIPDYVRFPGGNKNRTSAKKKKNRKPHPPWLHWQTFCLETQIPIWLQFFRIASNLIDVSVALGSLMSICESRLCISNKHNHPLFNVTNKWRYGEKVQGNQTSPKGGLAAELKFYLVADTASWISLTFPQQLARKIYLV